MPCSHVLNLKCRIFTTNSHERIEEKNTCLACFKKEFSKQTDEIIEYFHIILKQKLRSFILM